MKFCGKCGAELKDDANFCACCGEPCNSTPKVGAPKMSKPKSKAPIIGVTIALIVVLAVGFVAVRWYNSPEQRALRAVESGDYTTVVNLISHNKAIVQNDNLANQLNERIKELESEYENEKLEYEDVCEELDMIGQIGVSGLDQQMEDSRQMIYEIYCERHLETVYLCTSQITFNAATNSQTTTTWDYDEQGRLVGYSSGVENFDSDMAQYDYSRSYSYTYDDNGEIEKVVLGFDEENYYTLYASYKGDLPVEYIGEVDGEKGTYRFEYDENGHITLRQLLDDSGNVEQLTEVTCYSDGTIREIQNYLLSFILIRKYNENGKAIETSQKLNGEYVYRNIYDYNGQGKVTYLASYQGNDSEPYSIVRYEYDEEGRMTAISMEADGSSVYAPAEWDKSKQKSTFTFKEGSSGVTNIQEYDDAGNVIYGYTYVNGELQSKSTSTYIALQLPPDYKKPDTSDPRFMIS